jgi:EAL domain-containing protein (putative c-di-GMP-specific phosphodiesterase class I)
MYQAKIMGRNQFYIFREQDSHREQSHHRMIWREKIESALSNGRFILHYQPILDIKNRTISHYEILIRMLDENDEIVSPGVFINIAERIGLIQEIDNFILQSAIKKQGDLLREGHDITFAINLSGRAFDDPKLPQTIENNIREYEAKAENLIFEITETAAVSDIVAAEKMMCRIQALGCQFALDDFGVGFSSFYYLRELPVEYVKIDGSFVNDLPQNTDNQILVRALSEVAIGFNKLSVAEFVDSLQTLHLLSEAKVNYAQGYFIGKPSEQIPVKPPNFYQAAVNENTAII